jgi:UPF0755 protein
MPRERRHILRSAYVCNEDCWECRMVDRVLPMAFLFGVLMFLVYFVVLAAPFNFPDGSYLKVPKNTSVTAAAELLKEKNIIRSTAVFKGLVRLFGNNSIYAGEYFFSGPQSAITIARRLAFGDFEITPKRMVFFEGYTAQQMAEQLRKVPDFDADAFLAEGKPKEGYLFPDTYFVLPGEDYKVVLEAMQRNFDNHIESASTTIAKFGKPLKDVIIMASLLEREAPDLDSRRRIAGILWRRIEMGMLLQVDAVFPYIIGKNTFEVTREDLKVDSPYNTYKYKGLPAGPIANPGMTSILAAVTPIKSNYLFYLSDRDGNFHYCETYACHQANARKYLGN